MTINDDLDDTLSLMESLDRSAREAACIVIATNCVRPRRSSHIVEHKPDIGDLVEYIGRRVLMSTE